MQASPASSRVITAPRGPKLSCRTWQAEAALRMLMNNLDPEVAERPQDLVVYGGIGRAARNWECYDRIVESLTREAPHLELSAVTAGLPLPARVRPRSAPSEAAMVERARARGVAILGLSGHYLGTTSCDGLVVGYSRMPEHRFAAALERLFELVGPH